MKQFTFTILTTLCIWFVMPSQSQAQEYEVGTKVVNLGIGFGGYTASIGFGSPAFGFSGEMGVKETGDFGVIGAGAFVGFRSGKYRTFGFTSDWRSTTFVFAPRATYHFTVIDVEKLDVYAAVQIDLAFNTLKYDDGISGNTTTNDFDVHPALIAGARYYFNDSMAGFAEVGANGLSVISAGISFRF